MTEPEEEKKVETPRFLTKDQSAASGNIHDVRDLIEGFAANARGVKALKTFHKTMFDSLMSYSQAKGDLLVDRTAIVFHKTKEQLESLAPMHLHMEIASKENYSLWKVTDFHLNLATLTRVWGPHGMWGGITTFTADVAECEDWLYLSDSDVEVLVTLMITNQTTLLAKEQEATKQATTRGEARKLTALEAKLAEAKALQATRDLDYVRMAMELHVARGASADDFVSPIDGVTWSAAPSTSSRSGSGTPAGGGGLGSPKPAGGNGVGSPPPTGGSGLGTLNPGGGLSLAVPTTSPGSRSDASSPVYSTPASPHSQLASSAAQAQLLDERIRAALLQMLMGPGGIPGFPLAAAPSAPSFAPTITVNTGTNSELKKQNYKKVMAIKPLFDVDKFSQTWQALDVDSSNRITSFNMEHAADIFRRIITENQGRWAREPSEKFLRNATLFLFDAGADGLALEHFLGPKEVIGDSWSMFEKATVNVTQAYKVYFGDDMKLALLEYFHSLTAIHSQYERIPVPALTHLAQVTLGRLREVRNDTRMNVFLAVSEILRIDRDSPEVTQLMHAESYGHVGGVKRSSGHPRHPADVFGHDEDEEEEERARPPKRTKVHGPPGPPPAPALQFGPPPCYRWVTGKCMGSTCPVKAGKRTGPHPHKWNKRDVNTPEADEFIAFCKKWKNN